MTASPDVPGFSIADYVIFGLLLLVSASIGIWHACTGGKQRTTGEFLMANRMMGPIPVACSLTASFMSAITILGTPAEHYIHGCMYSLFGITYALVMILSAELFMPIFYKLKVTSAYEYLEFRFNSKFVRVLGSATFICQMVLYMGIAIYAPSLALNAVTGFTLWGSVLTCGLVCTFYTTIGGIKAVLWTDVFQLTVMVAGFLAVIIQGSINVGGWGVVMERSRAGGRLEFANFDPDPTVRHTVWTVLIGGIFTWLPIYGINQSQVQRYLTCRSMKAARIAIYLNIPGLGLILALAACSGLVMYASYYDCDPFTAGYVNQSDQLMPYFVMDILSFLPGLPGLFVACMFSGALSTVSSGLNSLAAVTGEDIIKQIWPKMDDNKYTKITKILALSYGLLCIFMAYISSLMGSVLQAALSIFGMIGGPLLGLFSLGMFFPWANSKGAVVGLFSGLIMSFWVGIGGFIYKPFVEKPPLETYNCPNETVSNITTTTMQYVSGQTTAAFNTITTQEAPVTIIQDTYPAIADYYSISYLYYGGVAWIAVIVVGLIVSFITGPTKPEEVDPKTISPLADKCCCCLSASTRETLYCGVQFKVEEEEKKYSLDNKPNIADTSDANVQVDIDDGVVNGTTLQHESGL